MKNKIRKVLEERINLLRHCSWLKDEDFFAIRKIYDIDLALTKIMEIVGKQVTPQQLHQWYLDATKELHPNSYNINAQKPYEELTEEQKFIDKYIADKINNPKTHREE